MKNIVACVLVLILVSISHAFGGTPTVTNLTDRAFTISWTTTVPEKGWVEYGTTVNLGSIAYDQRGQETVDDTHYVTITNLSSPIYYYAVISGGQRIGEGSITMPVTNRQSQNEYVAGGNVYLQDTVTKAKGAIVYAMLRDVNGTGTTGTSAVSSDLVNDSGWFFSLANFLTSDLTQSFQCSQGDELILWVDAAGDGIASGTVTIISTTTSIPLTLVDTVVPPAISAPCAVPGDGRARIELTMPVQSSGVVGVIILRREGGYPQVTLTTGATYTVDSIVGDSKVVCVSTDTTTWTDGMLANNTTYYYRIFTYDGAHNYSQGISCRVTPQLNLDNTKVYPNPLLGDGVVHFDNLLANTHICIYNIAGELVLEADAPVGTYSWSPKNIASGIYLYLLKGDNGLIRTGKIGIVR
ncbi:T9SS type A sorting domain-containing protein [Candidatus Desantisbacteria bacterium]|nr:T9SS type A sorting domain-containing protein [Candidatus Desantisbacteria bacterium]